ncbi:D-aminopeptidase [Emticicia aquatica]|uniref:D-aminopeptidase n=1 Tax=Emticicia aquatica TaxID=1681835 RepID=A0ABN8F3H2_9BACT|nr:serine hydrolase [Emticicia aquatica]CAH0997997.1 D-aminopeptidase [Emticicia aquatica]
MNRLFVTVLCSFFLLPFFVFSQKKTANKSTPVAPKLPEVFDEYIQKSLPTWKTPGLSVVVVKDGNIVLNKAYGVQNILDKTPYTTATLSTCASTTKAMTAICMAILVDEGKVKWSDVVSDILPEFKLSSPYVTAEITIKDLFTHNTGLGNADLLWVLGYSRAEILQRMQAIPLSYSLRASYTYQNLMYMVAGEVIKKITGKTWDDFVTERLFKPIGMTNTYADYSKIPLTAAKTTPHYEDKDNQNAVRTIDYLTDDNVGAAGGVWSCADDMSKWLQFLQDSTKTNGSRLLKAETFAELFKPQALVPPNSFYPTMQLTKPHWTSYGLGWFQHDYRGKMVQFHTGSLDGLVSIAGMIPEERIAVYVFGNLDHTEIRHALMYKAFDLWTFNDFNNDWSNDFYKLYKGLNDNADKKEQEQLAKRVLNTQPSLSLPFYTGKYVNKVYGNAEVELINEKLTLTLPNKFIYTLQHWNFDTFMGSSVNWWWGKSTFQFSLDSEGNASSLSMDGIVYIKEKTK